MLYQIKYSLLLVLMVTLSSLYSAEISNTEVDDLICFIRAGETEKAINLLEKNSFLAEIELFNDGITALHLTIEYQNYELVERLLKYNIPIDAQTTSGNTALHIASSLNNSLFALLLLEHNADPNIRNSSFETPLHTATRYNNPDTIKTLLGYGTTEIDAQNYKGYTSLHFAAQKGYISIVKILLENGANRRSKDKQGNIPLHYAFESGNLKTIALLLEGDKEQLSIKNEFNKTPFDISIKYGIVQILNVIDRELRKKI
ncbi:hypothetical protein COB28_04185 [Candidatus Dependentiae bacterium]|nr:MAG: hypothetical protein COB28_04185 [Candidatus Dependentiae bacterium]